MSDLIDRQQAIEAICMETCGASLKNVRCMVHCTEVQAVEKLPPANNSEIPNSSDTISRQAVKDMIKNHKSDFSTEKDYRTARACVNAVPPAQPKRIKGRWISADTIFGGVPFYCSECGENTRDTVMGKPRWNFCPNCGADMREVTE